MCICADRGGVDRLWASDLGFLPHIPVVKYDQLTIVNVL